MIGVVDYGGANHASVVNAVNNLGFDYISDDAFYLDLIFSGVISVYIVHYTLDNYSINIYDILIEKMNKTKLIF